MPRYELTLSPDYVDHWGMNEAVRELLQNGLDEEKQNKENVFSWSMNDGLLVLSNKTSTLTKKSLLLGNTSKSDDNNCIGSFGEGYKLALLVLTRLGYKVVINNYAANEIWTPKIIQSRRYDSELLVVDVKRATWLGSPDNNLTIEIGHLTDGDMANITNACLHMQTYVGIQTQSGVGEILTNTLHRGMVFVGGLFVCKHKELIYGYNFNATHLKMNRDRRMVEDFELFYQTSRMWATAGEEYTLTKKNLIKQGAKEIQYITNLSGTDLVREVATDFTRMHGEGAFPARVDESSDELKRFSGRAVFVNEIVYGVLSRSSDFHRVLREARKTPFELLTEFGKWDEGGWDEWTQECKEAFQLLLNESEEWEN